MENNLSKEAVIEAVRVIGEQLGFTTPRNVFLSWGVTKMAAAIYNGMPTLNMTVNGRLHKGNVFVSLNGSDYYEIYLKKSDGIEKICDECTWEEMSNIIDLHIEKGKDEEEYNRFCESQRLLLFQGVF